MSVVDWEQLTMVLSGVGQIKLVEISREGRSILINADGKQRLWPLLINLLPDFPFSIPQVLLHDSGKFGLLAHVNWEGEVCISDHQGEITNHRDPTAIILQAIEIAVEILDQSASTFDHDVLLDEFEGYWRSLPNAHQVLCCFEPDSELRFIDVKLGTDSRDKTSDRVIAFTDSLVNLGTNSLLRKQLEQYQSRKAIYLPLSEFALPPSPRAALDGQYFSQVLQAVSESLERDLAELLSNVSVSRQHIVLFSQPRPSGGKSLFGLSFSRKKPAPHPLCHDALLDGWKVVPLLIQRYSKQYLLERAGGDIRILNKKVMVVGCGSIGSEIAAQLARTGISELSLVDPDVFTPDNLFRHRLGEDKIGLYARGGKYEEQYVPNSKSKLLAEQLSAEVPYLSVLAYPDAFDAIPDSLINNQDVIVVATGIPAVDMAVNQRVKVLLQKPLVFAWLESMGVGGHVLSSPSYASGCLECLYSSKEGLLFHSRYALLASGQKFSRNLTGCGGAFTPFSHLDAVRTAVMASRTVVDLLCGNMQKSVLYSWKRNEAIAAQVTDRFREMGEYSETDDMSTPFCAVCANG